MAIYADILCSQYIPKICFHFPWDVRKQNDVEKIFYLQRRVIPMIRYVEENSFGLKLRLKTEEEELK